MRTGSSGQSQFRPSATCDHETHPRCPSMAHDGEKLSILVAVPPLDKMGLMLTGLAVEGK